MATNNLPVRIFTAEIFGTISLLYHQPRHIYPSGFHILKYPNIEIMSVLILYCALLLTTNLEHLSHTVILRPAIDHYYQALLLSIVLVHCSYELLFRSTTNYYLFSLDYNRMIFYNWIRKPAWTDCDCIKFYIEIWTIYLLLEFHVLQMQDYVP